MAKAVTYFSVKGGLNTEASPLNIPPEDCVDILNCNLNIDGSVERRQAIDFFNINNLTTATGFASGDPIDMFVFTTNTPIITFDASYNRFLAVKAGKELRIYPFESLEQFYFNIGVPTPQIIILEDLADTSTRTGFASFGDILVLLNKDIPFLSITIQNNIFILVRDGVYIRNFNLVTPVVDSYVKVGTNAYKCIRTHMSDDPKTEPEVGSDWRKYWAFVGPAVSESDWAAVILAGVYVSRAVAYTGSVTLYEQYRATAVSLNIEPGVAPNWRAYWDYNGTYAAPTATAWDSVTNYNPVTPPNYVTGARETHEIYNVLSGFNCGCFTSGRLWLSGDPNNYNSVYVSQSIVRGDEYSKMHQFADPYNPDDSAIVDSDGAVIVVTEASRILQVTPYNLGVLVFAENGVWYISGVDGFKTTSFFVQKISDIGILSRGSVASVETGIVFFGENGIYGIRESVQGSGYPEATSVGDKIQSLYKNLLSSSKIYAECVFDKINKRLYYFYKTEVSPLFDKCLVLDTRTGSWTKHHFQSNSIATISHFVPVPESFDDSELLFVIQKTDNTWWFGEFQDGVWVDFSSAEATTSTYSSYITMAHQTYGTVIRKREATYLTTIFERLEPTYDGSCKMRVDWNWANTSASPYFGTARQVYFPNKYITSLYNDTLNGLQTVVTKHKVRGWGNVFRFHFESEGNMPFKLLGWELLMEVDPTP